MVEIVVLLNLLQFSHIFDTSVGMTGVAELAELDGPFVKISLKGRFWHERSLILARLGNYLKQRIPVSSLTHSFIHTILLVLAVESF